MKVNEMIYVTGHQHPDSDSIVSAIAYAQLKQRKGVHACACRLGKISPETTYLLERFQFQEPMLLEDARARLEEIELDEPLTINSTRTIYETLQYMEKEGKVSLGVVDEHQRIIGLITKSNLISIGLGDTAKSIELLKQTNTNDIAKTIKGTIIYDDPLRRFNGKVSIVAINETRLKHYEIENRLVIVGNDTDAQLEALRKKAGILVVVWSNKIEQEVIDLAKVMHCPIIISGHGTMNTSRYLFFSPQIHLLMQTKLVTFQKDEFVKDAEKKMMKSRYRSYPVLDEEGHVFGYVSRYHILNSHNKRLILVDHNEFSQSVKGIEEAQLLEVIDHHRIGDIVTNCPISFRNEIIGSTTTIIASIYMENQMSISKELAGLMLGAIISDTLKFRSPTTTEKDKGIAQALATIAGLDIDSFAKDMFRVSSNIEGKTMIELIQRDIKKFEIERKQVMIGQVIVADFSQVKRIQDALLEAMNCYAIEKSLDLLVMSFTSIIDNGSIFYSVGACSDIVEDAFPNQVNELHSFQEGIVSRKTQIVPQISKHLV